jgi:hypothetical protein
VKWSASQTFGRHFETLQVSNERDNQSGWVNQRIRKQHHLVFGDAFDAPLAFFQTDRVAEG